MNSAVDDILEFLAEHEIAVPLSVLDNEIPSSSKSSIRRALPELEDRDYIERDDDYSSHYRITDRGREYLRGDRDASDDE